MHNKNNPASCLKEWSNNLRAGEGFCPGPANKVLGLEEHQVRRVSCPIKDTKSKQIKMHLD